MSSMYNRSKDFPRSRMSQSDSPPSSPSPTAKTLRHERLARLDSGSSSLASADSNSDRAVRVSAHTRRENRLASLGSKTEEENSKDFKKLYESAFSENEKLKSNLREAQLELANIKSKLERAAKKQDQSSSQAGLLEAEKRVLSDLKSDNQRLKDENGALIRVISKLSK
ncbi:protein phosphatase 1 regulatory subunit 12B-like isoform X2 [Pseudophryne corroboree]|uniref:protein phosphatase 1 regulatory subunit 12B-like isoform X2 n=1 Tax=Pseudophryne corroboree TaxID=495146 RepID=UPI003081560A